MFWSSTIVMLVARTIRRITDGSVTRRIPGLGRVKHHRRTLHIDCD